MSEVKKPQMKLLKKGAAAVAAPATEAKPEVKPASKTVVTKAAPKTGEKADTTNAQDLHPTEDLIAAVSKECETLKEDKAFKLVPQLLSDIDHNFFRIGGILAVIQVNAWFMDKGYQNFKDYIEAETDLGYRKAMYLVAIYNGLVASGVKWEDVSPIGWTKLKELATLLTSENAAEWVELAKGMTFLQLIDYIKAQTAGAPQTTAKAAVAEAAKTTTKTFKLHEDQRETVEAAIKKAKHESGTEVDSVAIEHICLDFLGGTSKLATQKGLAELMKDKSAEEVLGVFGEVFPDVEVSATLPD